MPPPQPLKRPATNTPTAVSIEAEVLANIRGQALGPGTVADLALPEKFLRSVASRVIQSWYQEQFRIVVDDVAASASSMARAGASPAPLPPTSPPQLRGFLPGLAESDAPVIPSTLQQGDPLVFALAANIAATLAPKGLLQ